MLSIADAGLRPGAPGGRSHYKGNIYGTPLLEETKQEIRKTLDDASHGNLSNRIAYLKDGTRCEADFDTGFSDPNALIHYVEKIIAQEHQGILSVVNGLGTTSGTIIRMVIERDLSGNSDRQERLTLSRQRLKAVEDAAGEFLIKACAEAKLEIPKEAQQSLIRETVQKLVAAALPKDQPLHLQYRNRPTDSDTGRRETVVKYMDRVWHDPWIAAGVFTRPYFRSVDEPGEQALQNRLRTDKSDLPFEVPRLSDVNDRQGKAGPARGSSHAMSAAWRRRTSSEEKGM